MVFSFVGHEQDISIIEKYDRKSLHPILSKSYQHLHFVTNCKIGYVDKKVDVNYNSYIFEMIINTSKLVKELINKKLLI